MLADQPDIRFWFLKDNGQRDMSLIVAGPDIDVINDTANQIASEMRTIPTHRESDVDGGARPAGTAHHAEASGRGRSRRLDRGACPRRSASRRSATSTPISPSSTPATGWCRSACSSTSGARARIGLLQDLRVPTSAGGATPLSVVADFSISHGPTAINRYDRSRRVTIEGDLRGDAALGTAVEAIRACRPQETCRPASRSARPATSR